jgi:archaeal type IV pilus assembly protein PilA
MNVFGKKERGWRKARKRGVSPIIATILLVAITVVLAAVLYVLISGLTSGGASSVPIGTTFAFGTPTQASSGATVATGTAACASAPIAGSCYNIGIQSAGSSATTANIHFGLLTSGSGASFAAVDVISTTGFVLASYTAANGWVANTGTGAITLPLAFASTMTLQVGYYTTAAPTGVTIEGSSIEAIGVGSISGTVSIVLP